MSEPPGPEPRPPRLVLTEVEAEPAPPPPPVFVLGLKGRRVRVSLGPEWLRVEGRDRFPVNLDLPYHFDLALFQVAALESASSKPTGQLSLAGFLVALGAVALLRLDALVARLVFPAYGIPENVRLGVGFGLLGLALICIVTYVLLTTSTIILHLASGSSLTFYGQPRTVRALRDALADRLRL